ncbi:protein FAM187B isoform X2 [Microcebus murinus]|uniref:protein FAM187B isoform X2 n=1 Tax=Microcebus murinus TaxID=30608 RepID=UPI003F6CCF94
MLRGVPGLLLPSRSTMLATLWLVSLSLPTVGAHILISCAYKSVCLRALLTGNDVVLKCDHPKALWYFSSIWGEDPSLLSSMPNARRLPGGSLQLTNPQPSQTGFYHCQSNDATLLVGYELDFQDASDLHITHKGLHQKTLGNETLHLGGQIVIFTHWEPWQDCNRCGEPGERKRLGYCYVQEPLEKPMPCWLYLRETNRPYSRMRPELQVEACHVPCDRGKEVNQPYFVFDIYQPGKLTNSMWLTCPLASIYRPVTWEADDTLLTWQSQLSGEALNTFLDPSTGGRQLQVFRAAIYRCFVQQEFMAQFNPKSSPEALEAQRDGSGARPQVAPEILWWKAGSVLTGLKLALLAGTLLALAGLMLRFCRPSQGAKRDCVVLVK